MEGGADIYYSNCQNKKISTPLGFCWFCLFGVWDLVLFVCLGLVVFLGQ